MKTKTYFVSWDAVKENTLIVENQFLEAGLDYLVYDVNNQRTPRPNWIMAEPVRYYGHFYNSLKDFVASDFDIFAFNAGDVRSDRYAEWTRKVEQLFEQDPDIWIMTPLMSGDGQSGEPNKICFSEIYNHMALSLFTNGIYISLRRTVAETLLKFYDWMLERQSMRFPEMKSGWGLDVVYAAWTMYSNKKIYCDWNIKMDHFHSGSYGNDSFPGHEYRVIIEEFKNYCEATGEKPDVIKDIMDKINDTLKYKGSYFTANAIYLNSGGNLNFTI